MKIEDIRSEMFKAMREERWFYWLHIYGLLQTIIRDARDYYRKWHYKHEGD